MGGATIQWLRDGLQIITAAPEVEQLASEVPDTGDVYLVPAFTGLGAPHWDAHARGTLIGMTRGSGRAHIARAALEAIALQVVDVLSAIEKDAGMRLTMLRADGGAAANNLLMQMQADLLGIPVARPKVTETTALGAAGVYHVPIGAAPKGQIIFSREPNQVGEGIVLTIVKYFSDVADDHLRQSLLRQTLGTWQE